LDGAETGATPASAVFVDPKEVCLVKPEQLERERKASSERRKKKLEEFRREHPIQEWAPTRGLSRAQRLKLREDDYVPPPDSEAARDAS
jgi:hypothetical protein